MWRGKFRVPNVLREVPLAASNEGPSCLIRVSSPVAGRMLTSASVNEDLPFRDGVTKEKEAVAIACRQGR